MTVWQIYHPTIDLWQVASPAKAAAACMAGETVRLVTVVWQHQHRSGQWITSHPLSVEFYRKAGIPIRLMEVME